MKLNSVIIILQMVRFSVRPKRLLARPAVTMVTAACMVNMVKKVSMKYASKTLLPNFLYPSIRLSPVAAAYLGPYWKKGYLNKLTSIRAQSKPNPKSAPALVDCTKWETPMAAPANNNPGPRILKMIFFEGHSKIFLQNYTWVLVDRKFFKFIRPGDLITCFTEIIWWANYLFVMISASNFLALSNLILMLFIGSSSSFAISL